MVNLILVSHGNLAEGLIDAMRLIVGDQEGILAVVLKETDPIEGLSDRLDQAIQEVNDGDGVLILVDLFGASPFNVSARLTQKYSNVQVVTGINLPMLLETALQREGQTIVELARFAVEAGRSGIKSLQEQLDLMSSA